MHTVKYSTQSLYCISIVKLLLKIFSLKLKFSDLHFLLTRFSFLIACWISIRIQVSLVCCFNSLFVSSQLEMSVFSKILKDNRISHSAILLASSMVIIYWSTLKVIKLRNKKYYLNQLLCTFLRFESLCFMQRLSKKLKNQLSIKHLEKVSYISGHFIPTLNQHNIFYTSKRQTKKRKQPLTNVFLSKFMTIFKIIRIKAY